jgi:hypothetical protein
MPIKPGQSLKPKYELPGAIISASAKGYLMVKREKDIHDAAPGEAILEALESQNVRRDSLMKTDDGRTTFLRLGEAVVQRVEELESVDQQG